MIALDMVTSNIWKKTLKPITILAPMEEVTDTVFRRVIAECGRPSMFFTEFTSVDGLCSVGREKVIHRLQFAPQEQPVIAQIWGKNVAHYEEVAKLCVEMGFSGIDLNMGCPDKSVIKNGCCSALIKNPPMTAEIIQATKQGAAGKIPVSVKTRIGFQSINTEDWIGFLLEQNIDALTIHGRTVKDLSNVPNRWEEIGKAVQLRNKLQPVEATRTPIIGNGDVLGLQQGQDLVDQYGIDGFMIGRGVFKNPWIFNPDIIRNDEGELVNIQTGYILGKNDRLKVLARHLDLWIETWGDRKNAAIMKKFYKMYVQDFPGAAHLRAELMENLSLAEAVERIQWELEGA